MTDAASKPTTIAEFLDRVREAYEDYTSAIASCSDEALVAPDTIGSWSVRDVIAHVGADEQWMAGHLEALLAGELPTAQSCYGSDEPLPEGMSLVTQDGRNAWQRERLRGLSLEEVRALAAEGHRRLMAAIASFADAQLAEELAIANLGTTGHIRKRNVGEQGWPLWEWLRGVTYHHYADHAAALRQLSGR